MSTSDALLCSTHSAYVTCDNGISSASGGCQHGRLLAAVAAVLLAVACAGAWDRPLHHWVTIAHRNVPFTTHSPFAPIVLRSQHPLALRTTALPGRTFPATVSADDGSDEDLREEEVNVDVDDDGEVQFELEDMIDEEGGGEEEEVGIGAEERRMRRKQWSPRLRPTLVTKAQQAGFLRPTSAQRRAIPTILAGRDVVIHAETGAGKTVAFLMPLVQKLQPGVAFQALIVCPSSELAVQTAQVLNKVWDLEGPAVGLVVAGNSPAAQYAGLSKRKPAVIIGAARQLDLVLEDEARREVLLKPLRTLVLDEVDALLPLRAAELIQELTKKQARKKFKSADYKERRRLQRVGFTEKDLDINELKGKERRLVEEKPTQRILGYINLHKPRMQLICASATAEDKLVHFLNRRSAKYRSSEKIKVVSSKPVAPPTKALRSRGVAGVGVPARLLHEVVLNPDDDADSKLRNVLDTYERDRPWSVLMAVGNAESVSAWVDKLQFRGIRGAAPLHKLMGFGPRGEGFRWNAAAHLAKHRELQQRFENRTGDAPFIVTTQVNCRGIDLKGVDVVYMTTLPIDTNEYQHLSGRSGREGRIGKAISFLDVSEFPQAMQMKEELGIKLRVGPHDLIPPLPKA
eukprot:GGOE01017905.1.p1 GENE.GGOE01017905.1~~GGOE01017905.1.p1  ORF type:complete len:630 (+),score=200.10 GGOE01017905.1:57-1946(+)